MTVLDSKGVLHESIINLAQFSPFDVLDENDIHPYCAPNQE